VKSRVELRGYIRFQLSQLGARNGAHEFEQLCFELARQRHVRNVIPATGPVQAGGDQGRDFESYRTYLSQAGLASSSFVTMVSDEVIAGACTLERTGTAGKIRRDLTTIFGSGERPDRILYFCEADVSVASRHKLQAHCRSTYCAALDLHDGQAIADQLADGDTFWIASQYLTIPADLYPADDRDETYAQRRARWITERNTPGNYADFLELRGGLRAATSDEAARPDILEWLGIMRSYMSAAPSSRLRQRSRYEIAIAELRGRGNLEPAEPQVKDYFGELREDAPLPVELLDAAVLVIFCWGAFQRKQTNLSEDSIRSWAGKVDAILSSSLAEASRRGDRCTLLEAQAMLSGMPAGMPEKQSSRSESLDTMLEAWSRVATAAADTPFFPVWHIADFVEQIAPSLGARPAYRTLRDQIDELTRIRSGGHAVAEQCQRRGIAHLGAGRLLLAIDELQRAKVGWFSGENMTSSLRTMVLLSDCYARLGLVLAARYYAAGAAYLGIHSQDDDVRALTPGAALQLVRILAAGGELLSSLVMMRQALGLHLTLETNPSDLQVHPLFEAALTEAAVRQAIVRRLAPQLADFTDAIIAEWPLRREDVAPLLDFASRPDSPWVTMSDVELVDVLEKDLGRSPFEDLGPVRIHRWAALGVEWILRYRNDRVTSAAALGLAATLQIIQADLAQTELLVIPARVIMGVELGEVATPRVAEVLHTNLNWRVTMPRETPVDPVGQEGFSEAFAVAATMLGQVTALDGPSFMAVLTKAMERDLVLRAYSVRPARELMDFAAVQVDRFDDLAAINPPVLPREIRPSEPAELAWPTTPAPGYTAERAHEALTNRYRRPWESAGLSLTRALADARVRRLALNLRADGLLDWQILGILWSIICQAQVDPNDSSPMDQLQSAMTARAKRSERPDDPVVDLSIIDEERLKAQRHIANGSALATWALSLNRRAIDPEGLRRFLDIRYRQAVDDIPHDDIFGAT
jgi:hypothetical protein